MARLTRVRQKVFASNASNNGVFGSLQAGNPTTSNDVATLQSLSAFENGWDDAAYSGDKLPPLEEFQGIQYGISYQQAYMLQEGIAEWDSNTPYYKGSLAKTISGTSFKLYCSIADNNTNKAVTNTSYWTKVMDSDDLYAFDSAVVHLAGAETITGAKTFTSGTVFSNTMTRKGSWTAGTTPSSSVNNALNFVDSTETVYGSVGKYYGTAGLFITRLTAKKTDGTGEISLSIGYDGNGNATTSAPVPTDTTSTSSNRIATTGWVNTVGNSCMHLTGNESAGGTKTFTSVPIILRGSYTGLYNRRSDLEYNVTPASNITMGGIEFQDKNNTWVGRFATDMYSSGNHTASISVRGEDNSISSLSIRRTALGDAYAECPTPSSATDNSTKIATTAWVAGHRCTTSATTTSSASVDAPAYIVENYKDGEDWYRVWSDGWIEQGGKYPSGGGEHNITVTFKKPFTTTTYCAMATLEYSGDSYAASVNSRTTTTINLRRVSADRSIFWYCCGY